MIINIIKKQLLGVFMTALLLLSIGGIAEAATVVTGPVGYVDFLYLINQHPDTTQANISLKAEQEAILQEFKNKSADLSDKDKQDLDRQLGQRLENKRKELLQVISAKVVAAANEVTKEKGLSIIIGKQDVVCGGIDVTADVLKKISGK
ncbi:MAG: periplasmic chaperone [Firmicutes bacterium]|nr:periplasmic chaperone [Bacillota bacterium]